MSAFPMSSSTSPQLDPYSQGNTYLNPSMGDAGQLQPLPNLDPMQYGMGSNTADPYAFSSQASSALNPSAMQMSSSALNPSAMQMSNASAPAAYPPPSPAFSDPYAPGGTLSTPPLLPPPLPMSSSQKPTNHAPLDGLHGSNHKANIPGPKTLPKWVTWLCIAALLGIIAAVIYRYAKSDHNNAPTPHTPLPPTISCPPPVACSPQICPPVASCPDREMVVRLGKGEPTINVKLLENEQKAESRQDDRGRECRNEEGGESTNPRPTERKEGFKPTPPIVIVNEMPRPEMPRPEMPRPERVEEVHVPMPRLAAPEALAVVPADPWGLTYAGSGTALPRVSDTNMVYTQIGGAF